MAGLRYFWRFLRPSVRTMVFGLLVLIPVQMAWGQSHSQSDHVTIRQAIAGVEASTGFHFLYRDALISGGTIPRLKLSGDIADLARSLESQGIQLQVDSSRKQILLTQLRLRPTQLPHFLGGQVLDDETGGRLPFATISWMDSGHFRGVAANTAGVFRLPLAAVSSSLDFVDLSISHIGYRTRRIRLDRKNLPSELPVRLAPQPLFGQEVVVSSSVFDADLDTTWYHLIRPGLSAPLGESNVLRTLDYLPSVSLSTGFTQGINVRGSRADGFQVQLDGVRIFNQNHFFGLFDAFNEDALQTVGFYYSVAPAYFQAPPGGTLALATRTGSQTGFRKSLGVSNTAYKGTFEGPLAGGRGSWLISGRHSYLNAVDWFNNARLIEQGLDVGRATSTPPGILPGIDGKTLFPGEASARFFDLHGKLYFESDGGRRLTINGYVGGDDTVSEAERLISIAGSDMTPNRVGRRNVATRNNWGNAAASLHYQSSLGARAFGHTILAVSHYHGRFSKDDFTYIIPRPSSDRNRPRMGPISTLAPFANRNELTELKLGQQVDVAPSAVGIVTAGYTLHHYDIKYSENSTRHALFNETAHGTQFDLFSEYDTAPTRALKLRLGLRSHYFSEGRFFRLSPRFWARIFQQERVSFGFGFSRNFQFLHRLSLAQARSADVWVMSRAKEPPGSVNHFTAGLYVKVTSTLFLQVEAYLKNYRNLRQHENSLISYGVRRGSILLKPWLSNNRARARGLEIMVRQKIGPLLWSNSYTLSRMEIRNPVLNDGIPFPADWDRRHQFTTRLSWTLSPGLTTNVTWLYATGTPNQLALVDPSEPARVPAYHRMDLSVEYKFAVRGSVVETRAALFNVYDRKNTWYRTPVVILVDDPSGRRLDTANVDVYDLSFQPSFSLTWHF